MIKIEELLGPYYTSLYKEYNLEDYEYHKELYNIYVSSNTQQQLSERAINIFYSCETYPKDWKLGIQLYVNVYESIQIYFYSKADLRLHISSLLEDENFKKLVKVAFFITENVLPKD